MVTVTEGLKRSVVSAVKVSVDDCPEVIVAGLKAAVIPAGNPIAVS